MIGKGGSSRDGEHSGSFLKIEIEKTFANSLDERHDTKKSRG